MRGKAAVNPRKILAELKRRNAYNSQGAAAPAFLVLGPNGQNRNSSASYRRADPRT
jgi:hypothetical protein